MRRRGRPPLNVPRVCSECGAHVTTSADSDTTHGVLRPVPLCGRCYTRRARRRRGVPAKQPGVLAQAVERLEWLEHAMAGSEWASVARGVRELLDSARRK